MARLGRAQPFPPVTQSIRFFRALRNTSYLVFTSNRRPQTFKPITNRVRFFQALRNLSYIVTRPVDRRPQVAKPLTQPFNLNFVVQSLFRTSYMVLRAVNSGLPRSSKILSQGRSLTTSTSNRIRGIIRSWGVVPTRR